MRVMLRLSLSTRLSPAANHPFPPARKMVRGPDPTNVRLPGVNRATRASHARARRPCHVNAPLRPLRLCGSSSSPCSIVSCFIPPPPHDMILPYARRDLRRLALADLCAALALAAGLLPRQRNVNAARKANSLSGADAPDALGSSRPGQLHPRTRCSTSESPHTGEYAAG